MGRKKKTGILIGGGLLVCLWMMVSVVSAFTGDRKDSAVMWVGEIPVYEDEFKDYMQDEYANTCSYFSRMYGAQIDENFWNTEFDGITPTDYLKEKAKEKLVEEKLVELVALDMGLEIETDYEKKRRDWKEANKQRSMMASRNQPVYGPIELEWRQYKMDVLGNLTQEIKNTLYAKKAFGKAEVDAYYELQKERLFKKPGEYQVEYVMIPILWEGEDRKDEKQDKHVKEIMESFAFDVQKGEFAKLAEEYERTYQNDGFSYHSELIDQDSLTRGNMLFPNVLQELEQMQEGEVSRVIEERGAYYMVRCQDKKEEIYVSRKEAEESIKRLLIEEAYRKMLSEKEEDTRIQMNEKVYESLQSNT